MQANHIDMFENRIVHSYQFIWVLGVKNPIELKNTRYASGQGGAGTKILERMGTKPISRKNRHTTTPPDLLVF